ncbi:hypothetical protein [Dongia deserti]|uniref:hypothetical protein n=1 Tax=Dongia deserti TaxID=2268030 RepID=UPI000E650D9D|nr:hypothetical protein [Dongia deserti]
MASKLAPVIALICAGVLLPAHASAQAPAAAILEEIEGATAKHEAFDELRAGDRIALGAAGRAVIGYLGSCARETIEGGAVVIGKDQSQVQGGKVTRETIPCEATQLVLTEQEAGTSATVVFRGPPWEKWVRQVVPSPSPIVFGPGKSLTIKRLDEDEKALTLTLKDGRIDLSAANVALTPGGYYELTAGNKQMVIKIDPTAEAGPMPAMSRLVRL